jgi:hypothetical protein
MLIFGRDAELVSSVAATAVATTGAGLSAVVEAGTLLKNVVAAGWSDPSTVHTFVLEGDCDPDAVSRVRLGLPTRRHLVRVVPSVLLVLLRDSHMLALCQRW